MTLITLDDNLTAWSHIHHAIMNELPVIRSLCLRKDLWHCNGANIASRKKGMYGDRLFRRPKNDFGERSSLFVAVLSEMGVDNIDTRVAQGFVRTAMKYEVKSCH